MYLDNDLDNRILYKRYSSTKQSYLTLNGPHLSNKTMLKIVFFLNSKIRHVNECSQYEKTNQLHLHTRCIVLTYRSKAIMRNVNIQQNICMLMNILIELFSIVRHVIFVIAYITTILRDKI